MIKRILAFVLVLAVSVSAQVNNYQFKNFGIPADSVRYRTYTGTTLSSTTYGTNVTLASFLVSTGSAANFTGVIDSKVNGDTLWKTEQVLRYPYFTSGNSAQIPIRMSTPYEVDSFQYMLYNGSTFVDSSNRNDRNVFDTNITLLSRNQYNIWYRYFYTGGPDWVSSMETFKHDSLGGGSGGGGTGFPPLGSASLCNVWGYVVNTRGQVFRNADVVATLGRVVTDSCTGATILGRVVSTKTNAAGLFNLQLIRGLCIKNQEYILTFSSRGQSPIVKHVLVPNLDSLEVDFP